MLWVNMALLRGWYLTCGRQQDINDRSDKTSMAMIVMVSGEMIILPEIPLGRRMPPWSRRTDVVERVLTSDTLAELYRDGETGNKHQHTKFTTRCTTHMMHELLNTCKSRHDNSTQSKLHIKWSSICNELHIDETPHMNYLVLSRLDIRQH